MAIPTAELHSSEEVVVEVIERHHGTQLRVSIVRLRDRRDAMICVSQWSRNAWKQGDDWRPDRRSWNGSALVRAGEVPQVIEAMRQAVERARELGWEIR